jgi:hypothetical protein
MAEYVARSYSPAHQARELADPALTTLVAVVWRQSWINPLDAQQAHRSR